MRVGGGRLGGEMESAEERGWGREGGNDEIRWCGKTNMRAKKWKSYPQKGPDDPNPKQFLFCGLWLRSVNIQNNPPPFGLSWVRSVPGGRTQQRQQRSTYQTSTLLFQHGSFRSGRENTLVEMDRIGSTLDVKEPFGD